MLYTTRTRVKEHESLDFFLYKYEVETHEVDYMQNPRNYDRLRHSEHRNNEPWGTIRGYSVTRSVPQR